MDVHEKTPKKLTAADLDQLRRVTMDHKSANDNKVNLQEDSQTLIKQPTDKKVMFMMQNVIQQMSSQLPP